MATKTVPDNPYVEASLDELYIACQRRAEELLTKGRTRTGAERNHLVQDTALLLLAVGTSLTDADLAITDKPGWKDARHNVTSAFWPKHQLTLRRARYRTLVGAVDAAMGGRGQVWMRDAHVEGQRAYDLALGSEEGLLRALEHLDGLQAG